MKELINIQAEIHAPKDKNNAFAGFPYRNAEGIIRAAKPLLEKHKCFLTLSDEVILIGDRYYIKATAKLTNSANEVVEAYGWAREQLNKKGNDDAQVTGASSSYARKYALCGLFGIDDSTQDPDAHDNRDSGTTAEKGKRGSNKSANNAVGTNPLNDALTAINGAKNRDELDAVYNQWGGAFEGADAATFFDELNAKASTL